MKEISFDELARRVRWLYTQEKLSHQEIADRLIVEGIAPALGHPCWDWRTVDSVLVLASSQRQAHAQESPTTP